MTHDFYVAAFVWTSCVLFVHVQGITPRTDCPDYVEENADLSCSCLTPDNFRGTASLSWPGHSDTGLLTVTSVHREDNGTRYTCQMVAGGTTTSTVYTLKVAYGPYDDKIQVSPLQFVTNWTQSFTMTCLATDVYPLPAYVWDDIQCDNNKGSTCTFTPHSPTSVTGATCIVKRQKFDGFGNKLASKSVRLNFKYPPSESPQITRHAAGGELLRTGDTVTCTVTGGRPTVDEVIFYCTDPQLDGHPGDVNATSVSSTITVDSARATEDNMTCFCSAVWKPNEDYYHLASEVTYSIEHKTLVKNLTLNDTSEALTVAAKDHVTVLLACQTFGRPRPTDVKLTKADNDSFADAHKAQVSNTGRWRTESTVTLSEVQCSDMGTYVCTASNGVGPADSRSVVLNVRCPPRKSFSQVMEMTDQGLSFSLAAYPSPDHFRFFHLGNPMSGNGSEVSSGRFSSLCLQNAVKLSTVNCTITPVDVPKDLVGSFRATVSNDLGSVDITFSVDKEVIPPVDPPASSASVAAIAGGSAAAGVVLIVVVVVVVKRRKSQARHTSKTKDRSHGSDNKGFDDTTDGTPGTKTGKPTAQVAAFSKTKDGHVEIETPDGTANLSPKTPPTQVRNEYELDWALKTPSYRNLLPPSQVKGATGSKAAPSSEYTSVNVKNKVPLLESATVDEQGYTTVNSAGGNSSGSPDRKQAAGGQQVAGYINMDASPYAVSPCHEPSSGSDALSSAAPKPYSKGEGTQAAKDDNYNVLTFQGKQSPPAPEKTYDHISDAKI